MKSDIAKPSSLFIEGGFSFSSLSGKRVATNWGMIEMASIGKTASNLRKVEAACERDGAFRNQNSVKEFTFPIDQSIKAGGTNEAPTPMDYVLASFNGCVLIIIERVAQEIGFSFRNLKAHSVGIVDRRGALGADGVSPHFQQVKNTIWFGTDESDGRIEQLKEIVEKRCPVYNLFKDAGVEIELNWVRENGGAKER